MKRFFRYFFVGALGIVVRLSSIAILDSMGIHYLITTSIGVEASAIHNFLWHQSWTWKDRQGSFLFRLMTFHLTNVCISFLGNLILTPIFVEMVHLPVLVANFTAIAICSLFNFFAADRVVFRAFTA